MQHEYKKLTVGGIWLLAVCLAGLAANVTSLSNWIVLGSIAIVPPILLLRLWSAPAETMSESIRQARR
jgi:hypothetical protein